LARTYRQLDLDERRTLFRLMEASTPVGEIAQRLGRHPSTASWGATASATATEGSAATSR
jgi:IS30 family transposase